MENKVFKTKTAELKLENGILQCDVFPNAEITIEEGKKIMEASFKLSNGKKLPILADMRRIKSMPRESRIYLSGEEATKTASALAVLIETSISKIIGNFILGLNKPTYPVKMFNSKQKAIEWLKEFLH